MFGLRSARRALSVEPRAGFASGEGTPTAGVRGQAGQLRGPVRPPAQLIAKHQLDVTEVSLPGSRTSSSRTSRARLAWDLGQATEFLVVAATLLDLKAARLLPAAEVEDEEDLALLEARDLLFARLLQYRAYKQAAAHLAACWNGPAPGGSPLRLPRAPVRRAMPDLVLDVGPSSCEARRRGRSRRRPPPMVVDRAHPHGPRQRPRARQGRRASGWPAAQRPRSARSAGLQHTSKSWPASSALLELYREGLVSFEQVQALGELLVRWTGPDDAGRPRRIEVEEYEGSPSPLPDLTPGRPGRPDDAETLAGQATMTCDSGGPGSRSGGPGAPDVVANDGRPGRGPWISDGLRTAADKDRPRWAALDADARWTEPDLSGSRRPGPQGLPGASPTGRGRSAGRPAAEGRARRTEAGDRCGHCGPREPPVEDDRRLRRWTTDAARASVDAGREAGSPRTLRPA